MVKQHDFLRLFNKYIRDSRNGKRLHQHGKKITPGMVGNYNAVSVLLQEFAEKTNFNLQLYTFSHLRKREFEKVKKYWERFRYQFSAYLYNERNCYDNYVGHVFKIIRGFMNWVQVELSLQIGSFHKKFSAPADPIQIVTLTPERLKFLISNPEFQESLSPALAELKDFFVFGCTVGLRVSDLLNLRTEDFEISENAWFLRKVSKKTGTPTKVKLPPYCIEIVKKHKKGKTVFQKYSINYLGEKIKELAEKAGWTEDFPKLRTKRGIPQVIYKDRDKRIHYRFCDLVSTHTMRRTAITTMLTLGMSEDVVRGISGHGPGSKEFFKYVNYSQAYIDSEIDKMHEKLAH